MGEKPILWYLIFLCIKFIDDIRLPDSIHKRCWKRQMFGMKN